MGADLYIKRITDAAYAEHEDAFAIACRERDAAPEAQRNEKQEVVKRIFNAMYPPEGYFRDSYNGSSLLWQLGLSWWKDVIPMLTEDGDLDKAGNEKLQAMIRSRELPSDLGDDAEYFHEKRDQLLSFLESAITTGDNIYCSL